MTQTWLVLVVALWGGLLGLERQAFLQAALSRPLPAAVGLGVLLGDVTSGLMVGLVFELFHLGGASLGGPWPTMRRSRREEARPSRCRSHTPAAAMPRPLSGPSRF